MTIRNTPQPRRRVLAAALVGLMAALLPASMPALAGDLADLDTSLQLIPKSAAFYSSSMRLGEQVEIARQSRAWARIKAMPAFQEALQLYEKQAADPDSPAAKFEQAREHPAVADLVGLLKDIFAQDAFIFGDEEYPQFVDLAQQISNAVQYGPMIAEVTGQGASVGEGKLQAKLLLSALADNAEKIVVPTTILGFKITDKARAERNVNNLAGILTVACMAVPQLAGALQRTEIDGAEFHVLSLHGEMIPWEKVPLDELEQIEAKPGDAEKVIAKAKELTLVFAIGVRDDYLLVSFGPSTECLAALGSGALLIERPELAPLKSFTDRRLASIGYASTELNKAAATSKDDLEGLVAALETVLPHLDLPKADQAEILSDARMLAEDVRRLLPEPGAVFGFSFLTDQGVEGYSYNWMKNSCLDGSKPLGLLEHVGGNPIFAAVWRERYAPENYNLVVKWVEIGYGYFEKYAVPEMSPRDRKKYEQLKELVRPLPARLDRANRQLLIPALADNQGAVVLDAKLKVRKLVREMPDPGKPMPMVEPALVVGVSDAERLRKACREYRAVFEAFVDALRQIEPGEIPEFEIPEPKVRKVEAGTLYSYPLPREWGVDKKITPTIGLSDSVAVVALSQNHAQRLLEAQSPAAGGVLARTDCPRAVAVVLDFAGLIEAARPWVDLAAREVIKEQMDVSDDASDEEKAEAESILQQVHTVLDVLQVFRTVTAHCRFEQDALITHTLCEIRDLE